MVEQKKSIYFVDTTWRDGQQSLWGMGFRYGMFDCIASDLNLAGYKHIDTYSIGLWMKPMVRFHKENPFDIFDILEDVNPGKGGEIQLTDALQGLLKKRQIYGYLFNGKRYDAGDKLGYLKATVDIGLKNNQVSEHFREYIIEVAHKLKHS